MQSAGFGRPYFVMELVRGVPITQFCDESQLSIDRRLELLIDVCHAVQHAHQKGIIHRDIKPSNVLVTLHDGKPVVKVIDFGIAKALGQQLTERTLFTGFAQMLGSPLYMSPEQAEMSGLDVDTRSDVYSLGVLLYELLTGTTPFEHERLHGVSYDEMRRIIREEEPPTPSTKVTRLGAAATTVSTNRGSEPLRLRKLLKGELDWIAMKALEKDRTRRYESASALAADVRRHLHNEPVQANPPSSWYRVRKFARRNRGPVVAAALVLVTLIAGLALSAWQAIRASRAETLAETRLTAEANAHREADSQRAKAEANLHLALDAVERLIEQLGRTPSGDEAPQTRGQGLEYAIELCEKLLAEQSTQREARYLTARAFRLLGELKHRQGDHIEAEIALSEAIQRYDELAREEGGNIDYRAGLATSLYVLADSKRRHFLLDEAIALYRRSVEQWQQALRQGPASPAHRVSHGTTVSMLAYALWMADREEAASIYEKAELLAQQMIEEDPQNPNYRSLAADIANSQGVLLWTTGKLLDAERSLRKALEISEGHRGSLPAQVLRTRGHLGIVLLHLGRYAKAEEEFREILRFRGKPEDVAELALSQRWLALVLSASGQNAEAESLFVHVLERQRQHAKRFPDHASHGQNVATTMRLLGDFLRDAGRFAEAEPLYRESVALFQQWSEVHPANADFQLPLGIAQQSYGRLLSAMGRATDAQPMFESAVSAFEAAMAASRKRHDIHQQYARFLATCPDLAFRDVEKSLHLAEKAATLAPQSPSCWTTLGIAACRAGDWNRAQDALTRSTELRAGGDAVDFFFLAICHWHLGQPEAARLWHAKGCQWMDQRQPKSEELARFRAESAELIEQQEQGESAL
jgi:tetratricopeptide (TPR) repeat protein